MKPIRRSVCFLVKLVLISGIALVGFPASATDQFEPDDTAATTPNYVQAGHPPQVHDLQATGGVADVDWINIWMRSYRSYEVRIWNTPALAVSFLERWNYLGSSKQQDGVNYFSENTSGSGWNLRWETGDLAGGPAFSQLNAIKTVGSTTGTAADSIYTIQFRESTLFCPRFNNAITQVSVLLIQAAPDGSNSCTFTAYFFDQSSGSILATQVDTLDFQNYGGSPPSAMKVYALPAITGLNGQKGSAQISHTCGYGNLKAKLVALEPASGFSFDTPCTVRDQ